MNYIIGLDTPWGKRYSIVATPVAVILTDNEENLRCSFIRQEEGLAQLMALPSIIQRLVDAMTAIEVGGVDNPAAPVDLRENRLTLTCSRCGGTTSTSLYSDSRDREKVSWVVEKLAGFFLWDQGWHDDPPLCPRCGIDAGVFDEEDLEYIRELAEDNGTRFQELPIEEADGNEH